MQRTIGVACSGLLAPLDVRNLRIFSAWVVAAALVFAGTLIALDGEGLQHSPLGWLLVLTTTLLTVCALVAYVRFIRAADELLRKIHLEGLALGFGAGVAFMVCYRLFERMGARHLTISAPLVVMTLFWALGQAIGMRRYMAGADDAR